MSKSGYSSVFWREIERLFAHQTLSLSLILIPIATFLLLVAIFSNGIPRDISIAVVDNDNSPLSRKLTTMIDIAPSVKVECKASSLDEGYRLIEEGVVRGVVVIPNRFETNILRGESSRCALYVNGVNVLTSSLIEKDVSVATETFSSGVEIQKLVAAGKSEGEAYNLAVPIIYKSHVLFNPYSSYAYYLLPGFLPMMLLLIVLLSSAYAVGGELKYGTAKEWFERSGENIFIAVVAKLTPYFLIFLFQLLVMNFLLYDYMGVPMQGSVTMIVIANILFVLAYQFLGVLITAICSNMRLSMSLSAGYGVLAFTYSGLTFPYIAMSPIVALFGNLFPMSFYIKIFIDQAMRGAPLELSFLEFAALISFLLLSLLSLPRLKKCVANSKYWFRD